MKKYTKAGILLLAGLVTASVLTWAVGKKTGKRPAPPGPVIEKTLPKVYDTTLVRKFDRLLVSLDFNQSMFTYEGKFNVTDGSDTTNNLHDLPFVFCREGRRFYSRLGESETINDRGLNVFIQPETKKVVVSNQDYHIKSAMTDIREMVKTLRSEDYDLKSTSLGTTRKISMINEQHITCKELSVTYDTLDNSLKSVLLRFTAIDAPADKNKERQVRIDMTKITHTARIRDYPGVDDVIRGRNGEPVLLPKFSAYELIRL